MWGFRGLPLTSCLLSPKGDACWYIAVLFSLGGRTCFETCRKQIQSSSMSAMQLPQAGQRRLQFRSGQPHSCSSSVQSPQFSQARLQISQTPPHCSSQVISMLLTSSSEKLSKSVFSRIASASKIASSLESARSLKVFLETAFKVTSNSLMLYSSYRSCFFSLLRVMGIPMCVHRKSL